MVRELCARYVAALEAGDLDAVLALFEEDAAVVSPLYGQVSAREFYTAALTDTQASRVELVDVLRSLDDERAVAARLRYGWTLSSGFAAELEAVDLFELNAAGDRFTRLTIVYDTAPVRESFTGMKQAWGPGSPVEQSARARVLPRLFDQPEG